MINLKKTPVLYSVGTYMAYSINKKFYNGVHYVWCAPEFNNIENQPPTSNPQTICQRYLQQLKTGDKHTLEISLNQVGILAGAKAKFAEGIIDKKQEDYISSIIAWSEFKDYFPVIYVIDSSKVKSKIIEVDSSDKASNRSVEYKIIDLEENEFNIIRFDELLKDIVIPNDERVGDYNAKNKRK